MPLDPNKEVSVRVGYPVGIAEPDPQIDSLIEFARSILHENESFVLRKEFQYAKNDSLTNGAFTGKIVFEFRDLEDEFPDLEEVPVPDSNPTARFRDKIRHSDNLREFRITSVDGIHRSEIVF